MKVPHILLGTIFALAAEPRIRFAKDDGQPSGAGGADPNVAGGAQAPVQRQRQPAPVDQSSPEAKAMRQAENAAGHLREQATRRHLAAIANGTAAPGSEPPATPTAEEIMSGKLTITAEQTREADLERERQLNLLRAMNRTPEQDQQHRFEMEKLAREKEQATGPQAVDPKVMAAPAGSEIPEQPSLPGSSKGTATPANPAGNPVLPVAPAPQPGGQGAPGVAGAQGADAPTGPQGADVQAARKRVTDKVDRGEEVTREDFAGTGTPDEELDRQVEQANAEARRNRKSETAEDIAGANTKEALLELAEKEGAEVKASGTKAEIAEAIVANRNAKASAKE